MLGPVSSALVASCRRILSREGFYGLYVSIHNSIFQKYYVAGSSFIFTSIHPGSPFSSDQPKARLLVLFDG